MGNGKFELHAGDSLRTLAQFENDSVDSLVTDPPAGISFMGKDWDADKGGRDAWIAWLTEVMRECHRVLKPGAHGLVWALPRTSHWTATALENAGFEVRDRVQHIFGSGFPKSLDVSKAIDKAAGAERSGVGINPRAAQQTPKCGTNAFGDFAGSSQLVTAPATDAAREWEGWGTALKPAWEPIILARKPLDGTVAANVLAHGTGALNIDACRIETDDDLNGGAYSGELRQCVERTGSDNEPGARSLGRLNRGAGEYVQPLGRWPANVVLDEDAARLVDAASGETISSGGRIGKRAQGVVANVPAGEYRAGDPGFGDSGGASRFFYTAKASRSERNAGLEHLPPRTREDVTGRHRDTPGANNPRAEMTARGAIKNVHPTVKPLDLMQWLCRLVTPRGGLILDPFCGSGTTGRAAIAEGFRFLGIELSDEYAEIARARITDYAPLFMPAESPDLPDDEPTP